jgi:hypothetical protein
VADVLPPTTSHHYRRLRINHSVTVRVRVPGIENIYFQISTIPNIIVSEAGVGSVYTVRAHMLVNPGDKDSAKRNWNNN